MKCPDFLKSIMKQIFSTSSPESYPMLLMKLNVLHLSFLYFLQERKVHEEGRQRGKDGQIPPHQGSGATSEQLRDDLVVKQTPTS